MFPARIERLSVSLTRRWYKSKPVKASGLVGSAPNMLFGMAVETKGGTNRTVRLFVNPIHQINLSQPRSLAGTPSWEIGPSNHRVRAPVQRGSMASAAPKGPPPLPMRAKSGPLCASKSNQPPPLGPALMNKKKNPTPPSRDGDAGLSGPPPLPTGARRRSRDGRVGGGVAAKENPSASQESPRQALPTAESLTPNLDIALAMKVPFSSPKVAREITLIPVLLFSLAGP